MMQQMDRFHKRQKMQEIEKPSNPANVYSKVTKSMWIIYFNPNDAHKIEEEAKNWDNISDADKEYRYQQVKKDLMY